MLLGFRVTTIGNRYPSTTREKMRDVFAAMPVRQVGEVHPG